MPRGGRHGRAKLDEGQVIAIFSRARAGEDPVRLAREFGVTKGAISLIKNRHRWRHLTKELVEDPDDLEG